MAPPAAAGERVLAPVHAPAHAEPAPPPDEDAEATQIVVTGSRLVSRGYQAPSPVSVVDGEELRLSGAQTVETLLVQSPQFSGNIYNAAGNGGSLGVVALNMRGLGEQRSLTLVNGRRYTVTGADALTDLNTIPAALVKRVEIVTGGSSAVYGSDAIAGVINFILRDDFKGVELSSETRRDLHTNTPANQLTLTAGGNFAGDKGNAVISVDYFNRGGMLRQQVGWARVGFADGCVTPASFSDRAAGVPLPVPAGQTCSGAGGRAGLIVANSAATPAGRFFNIPTYGAAESNPALNGALAAAGLRNMSSFGVTFDPGSDAARAAIDPDDRYNNTAANYMQTPLRRAMVNSFVNYKFDDRSTGYIEAHYSSNRADTAIAPGGVANNVLVDTNNPYLSAPDREVLRQMDLAESGTTTIAQGTASYSTTPGDGLAVLGINRRNAEAGPRVSAYERNVFRSVIGARGTLLEDLRYDVYYSYARTMLTERQTGNFSLSGWQNAMLSVGGAAPLLNPFGANTLSPQALQAVTVSSKNTSVYEQQVAAGNLAGSPLDLPAGPVDVNTGFELRSNRIALTPDALNVTGDISGQGIILPVAGSTNVKELYAEMRVPVLRDAPFARQLSLNGALRYSDYSMKGSGGVWTHSLGAQWEPVHDVTVRAQIQRAIRAPNIGELYGPRNPLTPVANDSCSNRVSAAAQTAALRALCVASGVPNAAVFTAGVQPNAQVATLAGGNPSLAPETADTTTFGLVYTPHSIPNLAFSADFYKINVDGAVASLGGTLQNLFDLCYKVFADANSVYCKAIHRDPVTGAMGGGNAYVDQSLSNTGGIKTSGIDLNAVYSRDIGYGPWPGASRIEIGGNWTYTREYTFTPVQEFPNLKNFCVGSFGAICGAPAPKWKGIGRINWRNGPLTLLLRGRYTGEVLRDTYLLPLRQGSAAPAMEDVSVARIKAQQYVDLSLSLKLADQMVVHFGINNLFNRDPPLLGSGAVTWALGTAPGTYELYGRSMFFGLAKSW
nr:TonB-dependent receptor [Duganella aceris]